MVLLVHRYHEVRTLALPAYLHINLTATLNPASFTSYVRQRLPLVYRSFLMVLVLGFRGYYGRQVLSQGE